MSYKNDFLYDLYSSCQQMLYIERKHSAKVFNPNICKEILL